MTPAPPTHDRRPWWWAVTVLALAIHPPLLVTGRGVVTANTDARLLLDPESALARSLSIWDPHVGLGTVRPDGVATLWPLGPWFWICERLGLPDWLAQRALLATVVFAAGCGVLYLARTWRWRPAAALAAAFAYALSPYCVLPAAVSIGSLLAFAGLPWLLALTIRSLRTSGWRHPAAFALVAATIGSADPTSLVLVGLACAGWLLYAFSTNPDVGTAPALRATAKIVLLTLGVNLWWISGAVVRATSGVDGRLFGARADAAADASSATEVLRGLGNVRFYESDLAGPIVDAAVPYTQSLVLIGITFAVVVAGLVGLGIARWRQRPYLIALLAVGTVIGVGAHPWARPSPLGALIQAVAPSDTGYPFRTLTQVGPVIVLALAFGVGSLVGAAIEQVPRRGVYGAVLAAVLSMAALPPLWDGGFVSDDLSRPEDLPDYWRAAAAHLDADPGTRILEIPGTGTASYRWGDSQGAVTPALTDRPFVDRGRAPEGSPASADLVTAFDQRLQDRMLAPGALATVARLLGAGDIVTRNDLRSGGQDLLAPTALWDLVVGAPGLGPPIPFGRGDGRADGPADVIDEAHLEHADTDPPPVAVVPVLDPAPIVRSRQAARTVLLSGSGAGIVDAASAGLIDGSDLVRYSAVLTGDPDFVRRDLVDERALIVTDTNRARARRWSSVRDGEGYTEQAEGGVLRTDPEDRRLGVFEDRPGTRSVAVHEGVQARATSYGDDERLQPELRPFRAVDGDPTTSWRLDGDAHADAVGERIELTVPDGVATDRITFLQAPTADLGPRITAISLRFDGGPPRRVELDDTSRAGPGQVVPIDRPGFEQLSVEIVDTIDGVAATGSGVGFAEIDIGVDAREYVRMPDDLLAAGGYRTLRYPLALVQTRERSAATDVARSDEESTIARIVDLPTARDYRITGTVHLSPEAAPETLDAIIGRSGGVTVTASSSLPGGLAHRPANVLDGDPSTRWTSAFDPAAPSVSVSGLEPDTVHRVEVVAVDDDEHSVPGSVRVMVDGSDVGHADFSASGSGVRRASVALDARVDSSSVTIVLDDLEQRTTPTGLRDERRVLPIAVTSVDLGGPLVDPLPAEIDSGCRDDLVLVDDVGIPVRITGTPGAALAGDALTMSTCGDEPVTIAGGEHRMDTTPGSRSGFDLDQIVWCSGPDGVACEGSGPLGSGTTAAAAVPEVEVLSIHGAEARVSVTGADEGEAFWLVLGQSHERGWHIDDDGVESDPVTLVDGASNGFLVTAPSASFEVTLRFTPQNQVEVALLLSVVAAVVALGLALAPVVPLGPAPIPLQEPIRRIRALSWEGALPTRRNARFVGLASGIVVGLAVGPFVGIGVGILSAFATRREGWRPLYTVVPAAVLVVCGVYVVAFQFRNDVPLDRHWPLETGASHAAALTAVLLLAIDVVIQHVWLRRSDFR